VRRSPPHARPSHPLRHCPQSCQAPRSGGRRRH
jgi:hypothetical protein